LKRRLLIMPKILEASEIAPAVYRMLVETPEIAKKALPGQFVIIRVNEEGERIPLTIADFDRGKGTLTIIFQKVGKTTSVLSQLGKGDILADVVGPLGKPSEIENYGTVVCIGGGIGAAPIYPIARALHEAGNHVIIINGARSADCLILEDELEAVSDEVFITTDDGTKGRCGFVTDVLKELLDEGRVDLIFAIGPAIMMKFACKTSEPYKVRTMVSLNSIMVDGTGMCGACRVEVGGKTKFCCADGPEFDGHDVDFDLLLSRQCMYKEEEALAMEDYEEKCKG
jgi:ferredoxin--NADP+ reductase